MVDGGKDYWVMGNPANFYSRKMGIFAVDENYQDILLDEFYQADVPDAVRQLYQSQTTTNFTEDITVPQSPI